MAKEQKLIEGKIDQLIPDDKNMNKHNQYGMSLLEKSISELGLGRSIVVDKNNRIIGGNGVVETAANLGMEDVIIIPSDGTKLVVVRRDDVDLDSEAGRKLALADNAVANVNLEWDTEVLQEVTGKWGIAPEDWGIDMPDFSEEGSGGGGTEEDPYSHKIKAPTYEPKNEKPIIADLCNEARADELVKEIMASDVSPEEKRFLTIAAKRHQVFDYSKIADYYAHSGKEMQDLMEKSALVIIDFNKAIENGYVKLTHQIADQYEEEGGQANDD